MSHLLLEQMDLLAQRRLRDAKSFGSSGEVPFLRNRQKEPRYLRCLSSLYSRRCSSPSARHDAGMTVP